MSSSTLSPTESLSSTPSPTESPTPMPSPESSDGADEGEGEGDSPADSPTPMPSQESSDGEDEGEGEGESPTPMPSPESSDGEDEGEGAGEESSEPSVSSTPSPPQTWTPSQLLSETDEGNPDKCYIAIFAGDVCSSDGGVYKVSTTWYSDHYGGNFGVLGTCGGVRDFWSDRSSGHKQFASSLRSNSDLGTFAQFTAKLACIGN